MRTREQVLFSTSNKHTMCILQYLTIHYREEDHDADEGTGSL